MKQIFLLIFWGIMLGKGPSFAQTIAIEEVKATQLLDKLAQQKGVVVVNFWSTWCKPCVDEIPHFLDVYKKVQEEGVQLWLVSQDTKELFRSGKLREYIAGKEKWRQANLFWFNETNADYYCPLIDSTWSGVIPATLIVNPANGYRKFFEESMSADLLQREILRAIQ